MTNENLIKSIATPADSTLVLLVMDGVGGLPVDGKTELETARTPNLDALAKKSICGLADPVDYGITPGSGPGHLALFGYNPLHYEIGRGVLEALGVGMELTGKDVAARGNFATVDKQGIITDRRAGRIATEKNKEICRILQNGIAELGDVQVIVKPGREHRFVVLFRGEGLDGRIADTDPQSTGQLPLPARGLAAEAEPTVRVVNEFVRKAAKILKDHHPANMVLLRGFAKYPDLPSMKELFQIHPAAIAAYPMYNGLAKLVGMKILETGETIGDEFQALKKNFAYHDFFYVHIKKTDSYGEDGNFQAKIKVIEETDRYIPQLLSLKPDVVVVTGDHSTPSLLKAHSWHPCPFLLYSRFARVDEISRFTEKECVKGSLGRFPLVKTIPLMLSHGLRLKKFGA